MDDSIQGADAPVPPAAKGEVGTRPPVQHRAGWREYGLAVAAAGATLWVRLSLGGWFGDRPVLVLFVLPILLSAYVGGLGPGLVSTVIIALGTSYFLIPPTHSFGMARAVDSVQWLILVFIGVLISLMTELLHRTRAGERGAALSGRKAATERKVQAGFGLALTFLGAIGVLSVLSVNRLREDTGWATHTEKVISSLRLLLSSVTDGETAVRGYIITGEEGYVEPYNGARHIMEEELRRLRELTADNDLQQHQLDALGPLLVERMAVMEENMAVRRRQELTAAEASLATGRGKQLHDRIRNLIAEMEATEESLLAERESRAQHASVLTRTVIVGGGAMAFGCVALALFVMNQEFAVRRRAETGLREARDQLEGRVRERTVALEETNEALRRRERRFRALSEHSADGVALIDANNRILYLSPSVAAVEGYAPAELLGRNGTENTHPDDLPRVQEIVGKLLAHPGEPIPVLWRRRHKDGRWLWLEGVATNLLDDPAVGAIVTNYRDITERKRMMEALQRSEEEFKDLFDHAPLGYHEVDAAGRLTRINQTELKMLGYSAGELLGQFVWRISAEEEISHRAVLAKLRGEPPPPAFERRLRRKDGTTFAALIEDRLVHDRDGVIIGIRGVIQDITDRKRLEAEQRTTETRYRTLFEYAPDGIVIANPESYYLDANASMCRMLGYPRDELIALHASDIVAQTEIPHIGSALNVLRAKSDYRREWQFRRKDGSIFPADVIATKMPDGNLLAMIRDITERRRTEQVLRDSEEYFRFLNDLAKATRTLADPAEIMAVTARMLGGHLRASRCAYAEVEPDGEQFTILHDYTDGCASSVGTYRLSLFGGRAVATLQGGQTLIIRDVGVELPPGEGGDMFNAIGIKAIITCPLVKNGGLRAMMAVHQATPRDWQPAEIAIVQDVVERCWATIERRTAEEQIQRLNAGLEHRVAERTAQLEEANRELEAFSYSVSHDLRAPLRAVDGFSQTVLEDFGPRLPPGGQRQLRVIRESAQRMGALIDDLLAFSRLSRQPLRKRTLETGELVRSVLEDLKAPCEGRQIQFIVGKLPACEGDLALLRQVWANLLGNAVKYTGRRDLATVEIGCTEQSGGTVYFVRDNGAGFDMRYAGKLFGVFQRLHRAEDYEGTGVGLAIVQRIIHRHGGRVWAEAAPDCGATFYFTLEGATQS